MDYSSFQDPSILPDEVAFRAVLGESWSLWQSIRDFLDTEYEVVTPEWKHYRGKSGWQLKMFYKKRNLFFLTPLSDSFRMVFVFGDRAVEQVSQSGLPQNIIDELVNARKYAEGRGLQIQVNSQADVEIVKTLIHIKIGK